MPILGWVQNKLRRGNKKPLSNPIVDQQTLRESHQREEFSDWPNALLAIGTFGLKKMNKDDDLHQDSKETNNSITTNDDDYDDDQSARLSNIENEESSHSHQQMSTTNVMQNKDHHHTMVVGKKLVSFLLKKVFVCRGGFGIDDPSIRDLHSESRMDKILRKILHKKIHPQGSYPSSRPAIKYLTTNDHQIDEEAYEKAIIQSSKWVKTDNEYIVLEI